MKWGETAAAAATNNVILAKGELGYTKDDNCLKVGDGVSHWNDLDCQGGGGGGLTQEQVEDFVGAMVTGNTETGIAVTYDDTGAKLDFVLPPRTDGFFRTGALTVAAGTKRMYNDSGVTRTIIKVAINVDTAPTGAALIVDANKNGTTIFTTQASRPSIAASGVHAVSAAPDVTSWADGDYLTFDVDQVGSTVAGSDLSGYVYWR